MNVDWSWVSSYENRWIVEVFVVVLLTLVAVYVAQLIFNRLERTFKKTPILWDDALLEAVRPPMRWLLILEGLGWAVDIAAQHADTTLLQTLEPAREIGFIAIVTWFLVRVARAVEQRLQSGDYMRKPLDHTTASALGRLVRVAIIITAALVVLQSLGYSVSSVLAFGGIGGLAIGFAAKDLLSNFFGGAMI